MHHDPHYAIMTVSNLATEHPEEVSQLLDAAQAMGAAVNVPPSWAGLTDPEKVENVILAQAQHNAVSGEAFAKAKEAAANRLRAELTRAVTANQEWYLEQREQGFSATAEAYLAAMDKLPEQEFSSEDVVAFDPETFQAYTEAKAAAAALKGYRSWLRGFDSVTRAIGFDSQHWHENHLILQSKNVLSYSAIQLAPSYNEKAYAAVAPEIHHAVKNGAKFKLSTGPQANKTAAKYEAQRQEMNKEHWVSLRRSLAV